MTEAIYSRVSEAEQMIVALTEKYPKVFWAVRPNTVAVMGIENKERSEKQLAKTPFFAKLKAINGSEKAIMQLNNVDTRYIIEIYWNEWKDWSEAKKQWLLSENILKISPDLGKTFKHDCSGFKILLDKTGVKAMTDKNSQLPNMLLTDVEFDLDLLPGLEDLEDGDKPESDEIPEEDMPKKRGRKPKVKEDSQPSPKKVDLEPEQSNSAGDEEIDIEEDGEEI